MKPVQPVTDVFGAEVLDDQIFPGGPTSLS
jgi:hypothetical protein